MAKSPAWQRKEGKSESGGLNAKGRASAKFEGHNLKPPVSKKGDYVWRQNKVMEKGEFRPLQKHQNP